MDLPTVWFVAIAVLWTGYFVLEGFDFGVGMLLPVIGRGAHADTDRRVMINSIGPVWDGNEVWLITAVGAMFAAFPAWYAGLLSGFYLPLLLVIVALILRGVAFEYRGKVDDPRWRARWDVAIVAGSTIPAFVWGVVFANVLRGLEIDAAGVVRSDLLDLLNPYALLGGITTTALFALHGAFFLALKTDGPVRVRARKAGRRIADPVRVRALKTDGPVRVRARKAGRRIAAVATGAVFAFLGLTQAATGTSVTAFTAVAAVGALLAGAALAGRRREGWAFVATALSIVAFSATIFLSLFPAALPSITDPALGLTLAEAASGPYTLGVLSWIGAAFLPLVVLYQSWSYWVFRRRVTRAHVGSV